MQTVHLRQTNSVSQYRLGSVFNLASSIKKPSRIRQARALAYMRTGNNLLYYSHLQGADEATSHASDSAPPPPPIKFKKTNQGSSVKMFRDLKHFKKRLREVC